MMSCVVLMGQRRFRARYIDACFTRFVDRSHRDYPERRSGIDSKQLGYDNK